MRACEVPTPRPSSSAKTTEDRLENRGMAWVAAAFVFCPCHLPITLAVLGLLFGGTAAGALLSDHPYIAGLTVTLLWVAGTWRGFSLLRSAQRFAYNARRHGVSQPVPRHHGPER
jgi:cytochrome c biogenesis protein CcdA